jgi:nuclear pore complex protein Nup155
MQVLENKLRSLEKFLRSRRNQRRGLYGHVAGSGDLTGSILYGTGSELGASDHIVRNLFGAYSRNTESNAGSMSNKRQRLPYSPAELAAMEVVLVIFVMQKVFILVLFISCIIFVFIVL